MTRAIFLLSKDPVLQHGGDVALSRVAMELAADAFDVSAICLSAESGSVTADFVPGGVPVERVAKSGTDPVRLLAGALRTRRSLVHVRFDSAGLRAAIEASDADVYVAEHSYMAESFLNSSRFGHRRLVVSTHVSEALVWRATRGALGRWEEPRLLRDELRVARAADAVATYDAEEAQYYRDHGVAGARWLELTLPPGRQIDVSATPQRMVFLGARDWPPNQEAFLRALSVVAEDLGRHPRRGTVHHRRPETRCAATAVPGGRARPGFRRRPRGVPVHLPGDDGADRHRRGCARQVAGRGPDGSAGGRHQHGVRLAGRPVRTDLVRRRRRVHRRVPTAAAGP